ncbi:hypothetical protein QAD02_001332 [Eretmocerus hayati]|uniref:Uncharacterized protein n=1 Tax=Eretmocerus hayati TaxID=131215 RepID=A0ACC2NFY0_9HYME|nr:hypothetical protein QAD02_001332 [Eretmocerus hayati]
MEKILEPSLNELEQLKRDEGVLIQIDGEDFILSASIINVTADELARWESLLRMYDDKLRRMGIRLGPIEEIRALINRSSSQICGVEYPTPNPSSPGIEQASMSVELSNNPKSSDVRDPAQGSFEDLLDEDDSHESDSEQKKHMHDLLEELISSVAPINKKCHQQYTPQSVQDSTSSPRMDAPKVSRLSMLPLKGHKSSIYQLMNETRPNHSHWIFSNGPDAPSYISDILEKFNKLKYYNRELIPFEFKGIFPNVEDGELFELFPPFYAQRIIYYCWLKHRVYFDETRDIPDTNLRALALLAAILPTSNYKKFNQERETPIKSANAAAQKNDNTDDDKCEPREKKSRVEPANSSTEKIPNENFVRFRDANDELLKLPDKNEKGHIETFVVCATAGPENVGKLFIKADIDLISVGSCSLIAFDIFVKMHYCFDVHFAPDLEIFYNFIRAINEVFVDDLSDSCEDTEVTDE